MAPQGCLSLVFFIVVVELVFGTLPNEDCVADSTQATESRDGGIGTSLLQATSKRLPPSLAEEHKSSIAGKPTALSLENSARKLLPAHLYEFGLQFFHNEENLNAVVANTVVSTTPLAGVNMSCRVVADGVDSHDDYDLNSLRQPDVKAGGRTATMNMLDIGGNYARVSIAAFHAHSGKMRIIAVEPIAPTYFMFKWNLWLNAVPELTEEQFRTEPQRPGVLALNTGISDMDGKHIDFCYTPPHMMQARICNCSAMGWSNSPKEHCQSMQGRTVESLFKLFGRQTMDFLKMDCEGCEIDVIPPLEKLLGTTALRIERFGGELHSAPKQLEDFVCKFENARRFVHICFQQKTGKFDTIPMVERCAQGPARASCFWDKRKCATLGTQVEECNPGSTALLPTPFN